MVARVKKCSFSNCKSNSKENRNLKFFNFRQHDYKSWVAVCDENLKKISDKTILKHYFVCENHFSKNDFTKILSPHRNFLNKEAFPVVGEYLIS